MCVWTPTHTELKWHRFHDLSIALINLYHLMTIVRLWIVNVLFENHFPGELCKHKQQQKTPSLVIPSLNFVLLLFATTISKPYWCTQFRIFTHWYSECDGGLFLLSLSLCHVCQYKHVALLAIQTKTCVSSFDCVSRVFILTSSGLCSCCICEKCTVPHSFDGSIISVDDVR